jgi:hypothetical protein
VKLGCGCNQPLGEYGRGSGRVLYGLGDVVEQQATQGVANETKPDIIAGVVAFGAPLAYEYGAPKKWPRLNWWQNVGAVVGLYFVTRMAYRKLTTPTTS